MASTLRAVVAGPERGNAVARLALLILLLALPGLAGCNLPPSRGSAPSVATVQPGESVYDVARRFNVPLRDVIELNHLSPPYTLQAGQVLRLPSPREYEVESGDSLYGISRRFGVDSTELARLNDLRPPYPIYIGQRLRLPSGQGEALAEAPFQPPAPPRRPGSGTVEAAAPAGAAPLVLGPRGGAAAVTGVPLDPLPGGPSPAAAPDPLPPEPGTPLSAPAAPGAPGAPAAESQLAAAPPAPAAEPAAQPPAARPAGLPSTVAPPARAGRRFQWPVSGEVLSGFGPKSDGMHNDGINIAAPAGTPVLAAENGVVAYTGNELRGYGNLLLIRHADGWVTAYAHTERILVQRGDRVRAGQRIATVGSTGAVASPQLHFEIRQGTRAINPLDQLPAQPGRAGRS